MSADIKRRKLHTGLEGLSEWLLTLLYSSSSSSMLWLYSEANTDHDHQTLDIRVFKKFTSIDMLAGGKRIMETVCKIANLL